MTQVTQDKEQETKALKKALIAYKHLNVVPVDSTPVDRESTKKDNVYFDEGLIFQTGTLWTKDVIIKYFQDNRLSGDDLNKTFHKTWEKIKNSSRVELFMHQILHYLSTYGTDFEGDAYFPSEEYNIPEDVRFTVIRGDTEQNISQRFRDMITSGMALKRETIDDIIEYLSPMTFNAPIEDCVKNKEAMALIAHRENILPKNPVEMLRVIVYKATDTTLLIKNKWVIDSIKSSKFNPEPLMEQYGLNNLARIFNRFKPVFLAFKDKCPSTINKLSKLSKKYHEPMVENPLNMATHKRIEDLKYLRNATPYALFRALSACYERLNGKKNFIYQIRNGKSWTQHKDKDYDTDVLKENITTLTSFIKENMNLQGTKVFIPDNIEYTVPTSEKTFVGSIPKGTKIYSDRFVVGVYWENDWGARDLDLSSINCNGKVGWNSGFGQGDNNILYSGDMTDATNGAIEYLRFKKLTLPTLVNNNIFAGEVGCQYKIVLCTDDKNFVQVHNSQESVKKYIADPNNVVFEQTCETVQKQTIIGAVLPCDTSNSSYTQCFVVLNMGSNNVSVSSIGNDDELNNISWRSIEESYNNPLTLRHVLTIMGASLVDDVTEADIDLSVRNLGKDSITNLLTSGNKLDYNKQKENQK